MSRLILPEDKILSSRTPWSCAFNTWWHSASCNNKTSKQYVTFSPAPVSLLQLCWQRCERVLALLQYLQSAEDKTESAGMLANKQVNSTCKNVALHLCEGATHAGFSAAPHSGQLFNNLAPSEQAVHKSSLQEFSYERLENNSQTM